jgi:hypothetical protein
LHALRRATLTLILAFLAFSPAALGACARTSCEVCARDLASACAANNLQALETIWFLDGD